MVVLSKTSGPKEATIQKVEKNTKKKKDKTLKTTANLFATF
jgi:hypothetical protein